MKFIKLISAEIKKIILKPSIFILIGLLVGALCINAFVYNPTNKNSGTISISGSTVNEVKAKFYGNSGTYTKIAYDSRFNDSNNGALAYVEFSKQDNSIIKNEINVYLSDLNNSYNDFISNIDNASNELLKSKVDKIKADLDIYSSKVQAELTTTVPRIAIKNSNYIDLQSKINEISSLLKNISTASTSQDYLILKSKLESSNKISNLLKLSDEYIEVISIDNQISDYLQSILDSTLQKCEEQNYKINNFEDSTYSLMIKKFNIEISKYFDLQKQGSTIISLTYLDNALKNINSYYGYTNQNEYQNNSELSQNQYLFNNNLYSFEVADSFNMQSTSNTITNGYDFMFNTLQIIMFIIIIFSIIIATSSVANEYSSGTIKLLLIRPYSRSKILTAKIISTIIFSSLFILLSSFISLIIGFILYGSSSAPILLTISASTTMLISPISLTGIYLLTLLFKCSIYILISVLVASLFRNPIPAIVIALGLYFAGLICNMFFSNFTWAMLLPFPNFDIFNYFMPITNNSQIGNLFTGNYALTNIFASLAYDIIVIIILMVPSYTIFKHNDI